MKLWKKILIVIVIVLIVIQFIRPAKNQSTEVLATDIANVYGVPADVNVILKKACNDCHSNNTVYPWYDNIQPVAWWLNNHIEEGKRHLNFSDFGSSRIAFQNHRMDDCLEQIKKGEMPLDSYLWIHKDAILSDAEKQTLNNWFHAIKDTIKAKYPADSLIMPKRPPRPQ